ncbi:response regulator [Hymenobacter weizhouensis]|uniref:response regulator n=1 Tax=Hymenobacter sp. YIM 151500-1 TaxID=2987689 RepID=UPI002225D1EE|nr:response regulator transcription factor [Hymenobacter sp. YIM 151500-1]UYZ64978.1 response regulator transcription factor [Hymenobacter sp. YIM 151500-1]
MAEVSTGVSTIQLLLVDDHPMVLEGLKALLRLEENIRVVAQATSGEEALAQLARHPEVHVAVVDLNMPGMSGLQLTAAIRRAYPAVRVLVISVFHDHASVAEVLEAGGAAYVLKTAGRAELSEAVHRVAAGHTYFSPDVAATLLENLRMTSRREQVRPAELTCREREILQLIAQEHSNQHIAELLFISERTVETHRKNILAKTNSKSVVGLIQYALRHKLIA